MTQLLLFNITNGLIIGAFYVLMALGLSLILNLSNTINFAHGGFLVIGGYIAYAITPSVGFSGAIRFTACCSPSAWPLSSRMAPASFLARRASRSPSRRFWRNR